MILYARIARRGLLSLALATVALAPLPAIAPGAASTGISDDGTAFFDSPAYRALDLHTVRFVIPWDAAGHPGPWDAPLRRAREDGADVLVAFDHDVASRCPLAPCTLPTVEAYGDALRAFLAAHPEVRAITPWNEPNHVSQPTARAPVAAAGYYAVARRVCPSCVVVAGDFLDGGTLANYLAVYAAALSEQPAVWGLHDYYDATYFQSSGVGAMLRETTGALWLTETGGIVAFTSGAGALPYDEQRAADSVAWVYQLADRNSRIGRVYLHQWQGDPGNPFDSGLLGYDGTPRPAYDVVRWRVGPRPGAVPVPAPKPSAARGSSADPSATLTPWIPAQPAVLAPPGRLARLRTLRRLRVLPGGRLELRARCVAFGSRETRCHQRLVARVGGRVVARPVVDVRANRTFVRLVRLPRWAARVVRRLGVALQSCQVQRPVCTARVPVPIRVVGR